MIITMIGKIITITTTMTTILSDIGVTTMTGAKPQPGDSPVGDSEA
jgi:hypothetical protein